MADLFVLPEMVFEVLLRVPAAQVKRLRQVSPLWRDIIDAPFFRDAHRRRRSPMLLVLSRRDFTTPDLLDFSRIELLEFDAEEREPRRLLRFVPVPTPPPLHARFPGLQTLGATPDSLFRVEGCFGGVVLISYADSLYACNPCTGRWSRLPPVHLHRSIVGLYAINAPGEGTAAFNVLFTDGIGGYCVLDLVSGAIRDIGLPTLAGSPPQLAMILRDGLRQDRYHDPPVYMDDYLYWRPQLEEQPMKAIVVFDTHTETFAWMDPPALKVANVSRTLDVDMLFKIGGKLAAATIDNTASTVQIWVRERPFWFPRHRILLPSEDMAAHFYSIDGMVTPVRAFIASDRLDTLIQLPRTALHADRRGCILGYHSGFIVTPHLYQSNFDADIFVPGIGDDDDSDCGEAAPFEFGGGMRR